MILIQKQIALLTQIRIIQIPSLNLNVKLFNLFSVPKMQTTTQQFSIRGFEVDISVRNANTQIPLRQKAILVTWPKLFNASTKSVILCIKSQQ